MTIFETPRLMFRHLELADFDDLYRLYGDIEIRRYFPDGVRSAEQTREELEYFRKGHPRDPRLGLWAAIEKASGKFVGRCGLLPWEIDGVLEIEIAYMIDKSRWREGFGSESANGLVEYAFSQLGLSKVIALIDPEHDASIRTAKRAGLSFEKEIWMDCLASVVYSRTRQKVA
ncbi:MAG: GNAT family N-acetyltransferase [Chlorobia bacterium]|nr:GNAT family N-acetyltransferase [Fimbriimonadaceae bacterium]